MTAAPDAAPPPPLEDDSARPGVPADPALGILDDLICFNLYAASHAFARLYAPWLGPLGLTYPQFLVLLVLGRSGPVHVGDLSRATGLDTGTLSPLLQRMQAAGLVARRRDAGDERRVRVTLTPDGQSRAEAAAAVPGCLARDLALTADDAQALRDRLVDLRRRIAAA